MPSKLKTIIASLVFALGGTYFANAAEFSMPGFNGTVNTTVTTGLSIRLDRNCLSEPGSVDLDDTTIALNNSKYGDLAGPYNDDGFGCAKQYTDGYGNTPDTTSGPMRKLISSNANDGNMNFDGGDIFDSTTRVYSEIMGTTGAGVDVKLSFVGAYNPITSFTNPLWAPFTNDALDNIETNIDLLDAYIVADIDEIDATVTLGRHVTNWGESTFIPIGMNGLTTNAIDLTKLRVPGASIKEALVPANQLTIAGFLDGGWSYEAYIQSGETHVEVDEAGTYFGNEVVKGDRLVFTSAYSGNSQSRATACSYLNAVSAGLGCTQSAIEYAQTTAGKQNTDMYLFEQAFKTIGASTNKNAFIIKSAALGGAAAGAGSIGGSSGDVQTIGLLGYGSTNAGITGVLAGYASWDEYTRKQGRKTGALDAEGGVHKYADGEGQFGLALRTYLDNVGTGVDLGFYFAQYDSKTPYLRLKGQGGIHAGDLLGYLTLAAGCTAAGGCGIGAENAAGSFAAGQYRLDSGLGENGTGDNNTELTFTASETVALLRTASALANIAYSEAGCGAYQNPAAVNKLYGGTAATKSNFAWSSAKKNSALNYYNYTNINGKLYHDASKCAGNAGATEATGEQFDTAATQAAAAALLGAAVTPLNMAEYDFVYPENLQVLGVSANTNFGSTTVQAELTYRPDFPLATDGTDQGQQLSDAAGTTNLLSIGVAQSIRGACVAAEKLRSGGTKAQAQAATKLVADITTLSALDTAVAVGCAAQNLSVSKYRTATGDSSKEWSDVVGAIKTFKRSSLPAISLATVAAGDYYTTPYWEYDVWTATVGTTTSFSASHPVTASLGADTSVLLTEVGLVYVPDLTDTMAVARGGYRDGVGGVKCGGVTEGGTSFNATRALDAASHLGSSQTDPLFGNGSYCESKNNADNNAWTYRIIGSATYNNVANTTWTFTPSFVWSHDIKGYGPSSMGGFVPGKQTLSLSGNLSKGDVSVGVNYINQMGDEMDNLAFDRDYISANVSYAF